MSLIASLPRFGLALCIGSLGGLGFYALGLPLPWLLGALSGTLIASLLGAPVEVSKPIRRYLLVIIGLLLGSSFTPEVLARVGEWIPTLMAAVFYLGLLTLVAQLFCRKVMGMDRKTALFSGMPGGLSEMVMLGEEAGADIRALTLTHACRVASVLLAIPLFLAYWTGMESGSQAIEKPIWHGADLVGLLICAAIGVGGGKLLRFPAPMLTGPLLISAVAYLLGLIEGGPPHAVSIALQLTLGSALGARFYGVSARQVGRTVLLAVLLAFVMMAVTLGMAAALAGITDASFEALVLALSPGGFAEMTLAALSLGIDPAFVTTHHALRLLVIVFIVPVVLGRALNRAKSQDDQA